MPCVPGNERCCASCFRHFNEGQVVGVGEFQPEWRGRDQQTLRLDQVQNGSRLRRYNPLSDRPLGTRLPDEPLQFSRIFALLQPYHQRERASVRGERYWFLRDASLDEAD